MFNLLLDYEFDVAVRICVGCKVKRLLGEATYGENCLEYAKPKT